MKNWKRNKFTTGVTRKRRHNADAGCNVRATRAQYERLRALIESGVNVRGHA